MHRPRKIAFVFPGQGSQSVGMGKEWAGTSPRAREVFAEADEFLGFPLSELCWEGPQDELQLTQNTQPAILATSVAIYRAVAAVGLKPMMMAGHSMGEYSANVAAGVLSLADALRLVRQRGRLMQEAVPVGVGAMAAVIGMEAEAVEQVALEAAGGQVCTVANYNSPQQTVLAGHREAVERAMQLAKERGAKRALRLPVSAPFHCSLMASAREKLTPDLEAADFRDPAVTIVSNVDAAPVEKAAAARDALIRQVDGPVQWVRSIHKISEEGVTTYLEIGPGKVLGGLIQRIDPEAEVHSLGEPQALDTLLDRGETTQL